MQRKWSVLFNMHRLDKGRNALESNALAYWANPKLYYNIYTGVWRLQEIANAPENAAENAQKRTKYEDNLNQEDEKKKLFKRLKFHNFDLSDCETIQKNFLSK